MTRPSCVFCGRTIADGVALHRLNPAGWACDEHKGKPISTLNLLLHERDQLRKTLPRHQFWGAGEPDCPPELKAPNGELHTTRCKVCGDGWRESGNLCLVAMVNSAPINASALDHMLGLVERLILDGKTDLAIARLRDARASVAIGVAVGVDFQHLSEHDRNVMGVALYHLEHDEKAAGSTRDRAKALRAALNAAGVLGTLKENDRG